jgi:hypothetical protein
MPMCQYTQLFPLLWYTQLFPLMVHSNFSCYSANHWPIKREDNTPPNIIGLNISLWTPEEVQL